MPHMTGKESTLSFFIGDAQIDQFDVREWVVERQGEKVEDGVCGEPRTRKDFITTGYTLSVSLHNKNTSKLDKLIEDQKSDDDGNVPTEKTLGIVLKPKGAPLGGYTLSKGVIDNWRIAVGGQTARGMIDLPMRFDNFDKIAL